MKPHLFFNMPSELQQYMKPWSHEKIGIGTKYIVQTLIL